MDTVLQILKFIDRHVYLPYLISIAAAIEVIALSNALSEWVHSKRLPKSWFAHKWIFRAVPFLAVAAVIASVATSPGDDGWWIVFAITYFLILLYYTIPTLVIVIIGSSLVADIARSIQSESHNK